MNVSFSPRKLRILIEMEKVPLFLHCCDILLTRRKSKLFVRLCIKKMFKELGIYNNSIIQEYLLWMSFRNSILRIIIVLIFYFEHLKLKTRFSRILLKMKQIVIT